jgi:23S rRNA (cytosine1962-C5)-methyltransferase
LVLTCLRALSLKRYGAKACPIASGRSWRIRSLFPGAGFGKQGKEDSGTWEKLKKMPEQWTIEYSDTEENLASEWSEKRHGVEVPNRSENTSIQGNGAAVAASFNNGLHLKLRLGLTSFKHVGVFPEQAPNWDWIYAHTKMLMNKAAVNQMNSQPVGNNESSIKVLNLFAYTGAASLAARAAGAGGDSPRLC